MRRKNFEYLKKHILPLSDEKSDFDIAKTEWILDHIYKTVGKCPCSQRIIEHCYIKNFKNGNMTFVGNICVQRFMAIDARKLFAGLRKIENNPKVKPNRDLIEYANQKGYLYGDHEYRFLKNIQNWKILSERQEGWLWKINRRIINKIVVKNLPTQSQSNELDFSYVNNDDKRSYKGVYHNISDGSDAQYDEESEEEMLTDSENDSDYEINENDDESDDDMKSDAASDGENERDEDEEWMADDASINSDECSEYDEDFIDDDDDDENTENDDDYEESDEDDEFDENTEQICDIH